MASIARSAHPPALEHRRREEISGAVEKQLWMLRVQVPAQGAH